MVKNHTHMCVFHRIKTSALELLRIWLGLETPLLVSVPTSSPFMMEICFQVTFWLKVMAKSSSDVLTTISTP